MQPEDGDPAERASCTTCVFSEDFSNYWTAVMFVSHYILVLPTPIVKGFCPVWGHFFEASHSEKVHTRRQQLTASFTVQTPKRLIPACSYNGERCSTCRNQWRHDDLLHTAGFLLEWKPEDYKLP